MTDWGALLIYGGIMLATFGGIAWLAHRDRQKRVRSLVFTNLDAAKENGYFDVGEQLHNLCAEDVAEDMLVYAADVEDYEARQLVPYVREWLMKDLRK